jgi:hypothetical protein
MYMRAAPPRPQPGSERLVMRPEGPHWRRHQGQCRSCGKRGQATVPADQVSGYGPRLTGGIGERAGRVGVRRRAVHALCAAVCAVPRSQGALQKMGARVSAASRPHSTASGAGARASLGHAMDETAWRTRGARRWLWGMAQPLGASFPRHPPPLQERVCAPPCGRDGRLGQRWGSRLSALAGAPAAWLGPSAPHSHRVDGASGGRDGALWGQRAGRAPTAVS